MGVNGLLPRLLTAGRLLDLRLLRDGILAADDGDKHAPRSSGADVGTDGRSAAVVGGTAAIPLERGHGPARGDNGEDAHGRRRRKRRRSDRTRKVRIAVDVSGWVARACHGQGATLLDERKLTNYGRAELEMLNPNSDGGVGGNVGYDAARDRTGEDAGRNLDGEDPDARGDESSRRVAAARAAAEADAAAERSYRLALRRDYVAKCASTVLNRVLSLRVNAGADVLAVLDGATPPVKSEACRRRRERREEAARAAEVSQQDADQRIYAARRAGAHTSALHSLVIQELLSLLRKHRVPFLVAPYEADGQLAYLSRTGLVDLVVTDDSDLVGYGTPAVLYRLEDDGGGGSMADQSGGDGSSARIGNRASGILLRRSDLGCTPAPLSLLDFSDVMLAVMFVAAGCDYCDSLKGIGVVKARDAVKEAFHETEPDFHSVRRERRGRTGTPPLLVKVFQRLYSECYGQKLSDKEKEEYEQSFLEALLMYRHPVVYDPLKGQCLLWRDPTTGSDPELMEYGPYAELCLDRVKVEAVVGKLHGRATATAIAEGWMNPKMIGQLYNKTETPAHVISSLNGERVGENQATVEKKDSPAANAGNNNGASADVGTTSNQELDTQVNALRPNQLSRPTTTASNDFSQPSPPRPSQQTQSSQGTSGTGRSQPSQPQHSQQTQSSHGTSGTGSSGRTVGTGSTTPSQPSTQPSSQPSHRSDLSADVLSPDLLLPSPASPRVSPLPAASNAGADGSSPGADRTGGMRGVIERLSSRGAGAGNGDATGGGRRGASTEAWASWWAGPEQVARASPGRVLRSRGRRALRSGKQL